MLTHRELGGIQTLCRAQRIYGDDGGSAARCSLESVEGLLDLVRELADVLRDTINDESCRPSVHTAAHALLDRIMNTPTRK